VVTDEFGLAVQRALNDFADILWAESIGASDLAEPARTRWDTSPADVREAALVRVIALTGQLKGERL
jgi:hypothetical protein